MNTTVQTSGTTGAPKRYTVDIDARVADIARIRPPGWSELTSLYNDFGETGPGVHRDTKWASSNGRKLFRPLTTWAATVQQFIDNDIQGIFASPLFLVRLAKALSGSGYTPKIVLASGKPNTTPEMSKAIRAGLGNNLWANYSVSEVGTLTGATWKQVEAIPGCVGTPFPGSKVRIVDNEIQAKTPIMIHSYNDPKITAAKFTVDGWLKTGDKGAWAADGTLIWQGRLK